MKLILLESLENLGKTGDQVKVRNGYARNYLIPQGKALPLTEENLRHVEERRAELEAQAAARRQEAQERAEKIGEQVLVLKVKASPEGRLFGSVGIREIIRELATQGHEVSRSEVRLNQRIHELGEYPVELRLHSEVGQQILVRVEAG